MKKDHQTTAQRRQRRRCRLPDTSFAAALIFAATALSTATEITTTSATVPTEEEQTLTNTTTTINSIIATYGPHLYHTRSNLLHPENLDYTKFTRINYSSFTFNSLGQIWETNSNMDPLVLFGPYDWNPDKSKQDVTYCHKSSAENHLPQCNHHYYERGLIGLCHMNGVQVFASVGVTYEMSEMEVEEMAEVFGTVASTVHGRQEVSYTFCTLCC